MSFEYLCPLPAAIADLTPVTCQEHFGQITKIVFQRIGTPFPDEGGVGGIGLLASWTPLKIAADSTKVQVAPFQENFVIPISEPIEEGGDDNSTTFGVSVILGNGQIKAEGGYRGIGATSLLELKQFVSESAVYGQLGVYLINEHGKIIANNLTGTEFSPFPVSGYYISSIGSEGFNTHNKVKFSFNMRANWSDKFKIITPADFDANDL